MFRTYSDRWKEADEENTHLYYIDLSAYLGECLYLELVDNSRGDWVSSRSKTSIHICRTIRP